MISVNEARKILSANLVRAEKTSLLLKDALDLYLSENIYSPIDVPSFDNSAMDGYAMQFDGHANYWEIDMVIQAGDTSAKKIEKGKAARIFTGAKIPEGADTVIPQELIEREEKLISYNGDKIEMGSNVRLKGSQCKKETLILKKGMLISPGVIGLLASVGIAEVPVYKLPTVVYVITGNELKEVGSPLKEGEIYNSNGPMLEALLNRTGIKETVGYKAGDEKEELQQKINAALEKQDVLILSGGISVGDYDFVKECLEKAGVKELFHKIKQRPGKPMYAGRKGKKLILALPGNPGSALSCFNQYVKPCLKFLMGQQDVWHPNEILLLKEDQKKKAGFTFFQKARKDGNQVEILEGQQSFNLQSFSTANCLVELEEEKDLVKAGTPVNVYYL